MKVTEVMTLDPVVVPVDATVQEAAQRMRSHGVGALPVVDRQRFVGMLTDRDIAVRVVADSRDPAHTDVWEVMTPELVCCTSDYTVQQVLALMRERRVRRLPVLSRSMNDVRALVGIVSLEDLSVAGVTVSITGRVLETAAP